jgi:class 3 adenylate cyclase
MHPPVQYARSGNVQVAYQVTGGGPVDLVWAPGLISHLDLEWEWPPRARFQDELGSFCRLIRFDKRGTGLSDRPTAAATIEERTDDIRAVMDAAGSDAAFIFGQSEGANMACVFAAMYPKRTRGLLVWGGQARWVRTRGYRWGMSRKEKERELRTLLQKGIGLEYLGITPHDQLEDPAQIDWFLRFARAGGSPSAIAAMERMNFDIDVSDILPAIRVRALIMNRTGDPVANVEAARDLARRIPGARFVEFPGDTHSIAAIEPERVLAEIKGFITGTQYQVSGDRVLSTIVCLDIVGSTQTAAKLGDRRWRQLLDRYYDMLERHLAAHGGTEIDRAGDGLMATFDGPSRAIRFAVIVQRDAAPLDLHLRVGVHTGEVEVSNRARRGIAVHVAARLSALAGSNEVLVSSTVKDLVAGSGLILRDRGLHKLKGVPERWRTYAASLPRPDVETPLP